MDYNPRRVRDDRPKRGGWAPGGYQNLCFSCGFLFIGDKRATSCADCAYPDPSVDPDATNAGDSPR